MGLISRVSSRTYRNETLSALKMYSDEGPKIVACVKDVNQSDFVTEFGEFLKQSGKISPPKWADLAKTANFKQMSPADDDWFYFRTAAIARQLYIKGTVGTGRMSKIYGGSANRGFKPSRTHKGNGHIARLAFQQLEKVGLVEKADKSRRLSSAGRQDMDRIAGRLVLAAKKK